MTVLSAMQSAAIRLIGRKPLPFFNSTGKFEMEITDLINEVAEDIAQYRDWQALVKSVTLTGDGTTTEFALPTDYSRMFLTGRVQNLPTWAWGYFRYDSLDDYLLAQASGFPGLPGGWVISGSEMLFSPAPQTGPSVTFTYLSKNWARASNGSAKAMFTADNDTFVLPERLLALGLIWRWRENKKLDASGDQEAFTKALDEYAAKDGGSQVLRRRQTRHLPGTHMAWPWALGPDTY